MRVVIQRVQNSRVEVGERTTGEIGDGLLVLAGFAPDDNVETLTQMAAKIINLRIFEDSDGRMNLSLLDRVLPVLVVSQFTLYADCRKGRRPSFTGAAPPDLAEEQYNKFVAILRGMGVRAETGEFRAMMRVSLVNWGPVTIVLDTSDFAG